MPKEKIEGFSSLIIFVFSAPRSLSPSRIFGAVVDFSDANALYAALSSACLLALPPLAWLLGRRKRAAPRHKTGPDAQALLDACQDAIVGANEEGAITSWNTGAEALFGYTTEEAGGLPASLLFAEDRRDEAARLLEQARQGRRLQGVETLIARKDGRPIPVSLELSPVRDAAGRAVGTAAIIRDITDLKQAGSLSRERRDQLLRFVEQAPVCIAMLDLDMRYIAVSRRWIADFGKGYSELAGLSHYQLHPDLPERWKQIHRECLAGAVRESSEDRWSQAGGGERWLRWAVHPWVDAQGKIGGILIFAEDITEQKQAEERIKRLNGELQSKLDELQTVLDVVPVAIAIAYDRQCQNIRLNRAGEAMLGLAPGINASKSADVGGRLPFKVLRDGMELASDDLPMQYAARHATPVREVEIDIVRQDGKSLSLYEYASPLYDDAGKVRGCVGVFVDITELKRAEEALREADRRKDEFLAMLAHELRNPLAPIRNALQVMKALGPKEPRFEWSRAVIERQIGQMARLLDDLLDVARVMQGKLVLKPERVALADIVERALESSLPLIEERRQTISVTLPEDAHWLEGDPARLAQALSNLLNNAAKYTGEEGRISLSAELEGDETVIRVRDTGAGIAPELLPRMFELFAQADDSLAHAQGGLGLGLPLARQLAEMHGGTLTGTSEGLGRGSEFALRLPLSPEQAPPPRPAAPPAGKPGKLRILVVDDYADTAETLAVWLRLAGHDVMSAASGAKALESAARFRPHVILLDIGLPDMDGYAVAKALRQSAATRQAVLVALTGYGQGEDLRNSSAAGFDHHFLKPAPPEELSSLLASVAARLGLEGQSS
jgi:PAS domain S-box-containing protein